MWASHSLMNMSPVAHWGPGSGLWLLRIATIQIIKGKKEKRRETLSLILICSKGWMLLHLSTIKVDLST